MYFFLSHESVSEIDLAKIKTVKESQIHFLPER